MAAAPDVQRQQLRCAHVDGGGARRAASGTASRTHRWRRRPTCSSSNGAAHTTALCRQRRCADNGVAQTTALRRQRRCADDG
eukprot:5468255-Pleurochrysis_carterae.AAC.1